MPKLIPQSTLDAILQAVSRFPEGASLSDISGALGIKLPRRTLQRHLAYLVGQERVMTKGKSRNSRYLSQVVISPGAETKPDREEIGVPMSPEGIAIREAIRRPIQSRTPVGYNRRMLDGYRPNETFYLPAEIRRHLAVCGRSPDGELPAGTYLRQVFHRLLIDLSWNSSRLEGNTYSLLETERLLELGEAAEGKDVRDAQMILNHKAAIELLADPSAGVGFNRYTILNLHALLSDNLLADPRSCGRLRAMSVGIGGTVYHPLEVPQLIEECFMQLLDTAEAIGDPFEQAFFFTVHMPYLQPFEDVNKRVARLAANIPLIRHNLCPLSFVDVPQRAYIDGILGVYELNRSELARDVFVWAYERSCARYSAVRQSLREPDPFRLRYRQLMTDGIGEIVVGRMDKRSAVAAIHRLSGEKVPEEDRARFSELIETELLGLHEGNIARHRLRPSQYHAWREAWH